VGVFGAKSILVVLGAKSILEKKNRPGPDGPNASGWSTPWADFAVIKTVSFNFNSR